jgi:hypothetical protein
MEGFTGADIDQLSIAAKVVANREEMAKKEKEKYLGKKGKDPGYGPQGGRREDWRLEGRPQQERTEKPSGKKISAPTVRRRDIGKMSALTRKERKKKE